MAIDEIESGGEGEEPFPSGCNGAEVGADIEGRSEGEESFHDSELIGNPVEGPKKREGEKKEPLRLFVTPNSVKEKGGEQHVKQELMKKFDSLPKLI